MHVHCTVLTVVVKQLLLIFVPIFNDVFFWQLQVHVGISIQEFKKS